MPDLFSTTLFEAAYESVVFPCIDAPIESGHDNVEHEAYARRGADIEPTGQRPYRGQLTAALVNGLEGFRGQNIFPGRLRELIERFEAQPQGILVHPVWGPLLAQIVSWHIHVKPEVRNGVFMDITWTEHNATASILNAAAGRTPADSQQAVTSDLAAAQAALGALPPAVTSLYTPADVVTIAALTTTVTTEMNALTNATLGNSAAEESFRRMAGAATSVLGIVALQGVLANEAVLAVELLRASVYAYRSAYLAGLGDARVYVTRGTVSVWVVALEVYGDTSFSSLILAANSIPDPVFIPQGTRLLIPVPRTTV